jgi:hypothetical protein
MDEDLRYLILDIFEASLEAQLRAVRRLREPAASSAPARTSMSQVDMAYDILKRARGPLHVSVLLQRMEGAFGVAVDRESLVSSLSKKIARRDRFTRTGKNTFGLLAEAK